jgi:hypothetical protein
MRKQITILAIAASLSGCADMGFGKRGQAIEQEAASTAISLCKKFGHKPETKAFTLCAEQRFDEYMVNNR